MSRKRDREKRKQRIEERAQDKMWAQNCAHPVAEFIAAGWTCPDIKAGKPECDEIPF